MQRTFTTLVRTARAKSLTNNAFIVRKGTPSHDFSVLPLTEKVFNSLDVNKDGTLDESELVQSANILGLSIPETRALFKELDANHDGKVTLDEFSNVSAHNKIGKPLSFSTEHLAASNVNENQPLTSLSFATPESGFCAPSLEEQTRQDYVPNMCFSSPESDFCAPSMEEQTRQVYVPNISFSSPESDFCAPTQEEQNVQKRKIDSKIFFFPSSLSFASPESDFCAPSLEEQTKESHVPNFSFSSPESDFCAPSIEEQTRQVYVPNMSFSSPESDFCAPTLEEQMEEPHVPNLSFSSPESDFCAPSSEEQTRQTHTPTMSFSSPESDFCAPTVEEQTKEHYVPNLSFASPESDFCAASPTEMAEQETISMQLAVAPTTESRVITEAKHPFRIVHVNSAWTRLCGYTQEESLGRSLNILQGPKTELEQLSKLEAQIEQENAASTHLTNYSKQGRVFTNHLRVNPIVDGSGEVTHFMGTLEEVVDNKMSQ